MVEKPETGLMPGRVMAGDRKRGKDEEEGGEWDGEVMNEEERSSD